MEEEEEERPNFVCLILDWRVPASPDGRAGLRDGLPSSSSIQEQRLVGMPPKQEGTKTEERCSSSSSSSLPCRSPGGLVLKKTFRPYRTIASPKTEMGFAEGRRAVGGEEERRNSLTKFGLGRQRRSPLPPSGRRFRKREEIPLVSPTSLSLLQKVHLAFPHP